MPILENGQLKVKVNQSNSKQGFQHVDFTCLLTPLAAQEAVALATRIEYLYAGEKRAASANKAANVFDHWVRMWQVNASMFTFQAGSAPKLFLVLLELRKSYMMRISEDATEAVLASLCDYWNSFLRLMKRLGEQKGGTPVLSYKQLLADPRISSNAFKQKEKVLTDEQAFEVASSVLRGIDVDNDSFSDKLVVPVSLKKSDIEYLDWYQAELQKAHDAFMVCNLNDMHFFERLAAEGIAMIADTDYQAIRTHIDNTGKLDLKYKDPVNGLPFFQEEHPSHLHHLLALVHHEMGGVPKPYIRAVGSRKDGTQSTVRNGPRHWSHVQRFGAYRLLPYLGILTAEAVVPLVNIILQENPRINVESLIGADLKDVYGNLKLLSTAGDEGKETRLTVAKPRAFSTKSVILSSHSKVAVELLLAWTAPLRTILENEGNPDASKFLLIMDRNYRITPVYPVPMWAHFKGKPKSRIPLSGKFTHWDELSSKPIPFLYRHPELEPYRERASMAALRTSAFVLKWLRSDGNYEDARLEIGHQDIRVAINNYIPPALQRALNTRCIRRFQNFLIIAATAGKPYMLAATDFNTMEDVHEFLAGMLDVPNDWSGNPLVDRIRRAMAPAANPTIPPTAASASSPIHKLLWKISDHGLALLRLYREQILEINPAQDVLDCPDRKTGISPAFWLELGNLVVAVDKGQVAVDKKFAPLFRKSMEMAETLREKVRFPDILSLRSANNG